MGPEPDDLDVVGFGPVAPRHTIKLYEKEAAVKLGTSHLISAQPASRPGGLIDR